MCSASLNGCRDTQHPIWRTKEERLFSGDQVVGRQGPAHHQEYCSNICGVVFHVSPHLYDFVADACRLDSFTSAVAFRSVTPRLWSGFLVWLL